MKRINDVEGGERLATRVLAVTNRVLDHALEVRLEYAADLLVDETADALDAATCSWKDESQAQGSLGEAGRMGGGGAAYGERGDE